MNLGMASLAQAPSISFITKIPQVRSKCSLLLKASRVPYVIPFRHIHLRRPPVCCTKFPQWEPSPVTYTLTEKSGENFLDKSSELFETLRPESNDDKALVTKAKDLTDTTNQPVAQFQFLKWPLWLLGPSLLLGTGMVPTLWLPISTIFIGPNVVSLLSLIGLDFIFNLGCTLFLLMADYCAKSKNMTQASKSKPPLSYQFWNLVATLTGLAIPLMILFGSHKGYLQPRLPFIPYAVLLGPYILLLAVQMLTEVLTWHWESPVWLVTPVVYEAYRVLQLMRGLKLGVELSAPAWMMHTIRGMVCWWVLILGVQLMRVAWFAGFTAQARRQQVS
ncbi:uncharacterized protein LOC120215582 isoform X1 [Hibiscus syriacus]|uniref:uncharacterized protein LOC120215582 isoform X1 n=2 Tax=Hibiscus syriacus TaxID=106335 RepID=UPI00192258FC|nr:uncharacterized protein LOC120215582 isoform X1 [Hibiscus syriacus]